MKLLVIADDFTGAVDTGAQFKAKDVLIRVGEEQALLPGTDRQTQVLILDAETRHMGAEEAYRTIYRIVSRAVELGIPCISSMGTGNKLDPSRFVITDIAKTTGCPLARVMRKELRNHGIEHHTVLFSEEPPAKPLELETPPPGRRSIPASVSWVPSVAGLMIAGHVVRDLLQIAPKSTV